MMDKASMLDEVFRRAEDIRHRQVRGQVRRLGTAASGLLIALLVMVGSLAGGASVRPTAMGAFLLGPAAGGYVIVALLAFALGVALTLAAQKCRRSKGLETTEQDGNDRRGGHL